jgi:outer membrane protein assembly factor BamB
MSDDTLASNGDIVLADDDRVYVADGFGAGNAEYKVSVFDAGNGEVIWQRDDLTTEVSVDDVFLQALVGDTLVVNGQYDSVVAVEAGTGEILWFFPLPEGYGAVRSAVVDDVLVVGTEAPTEGDIRPPIVYALHLADGSLLWETALAVGMDLQWHSPPIADGLAFVSSTISHPQSASGNMIHAVNVSTGEIQWVAELGGDQGFHFYPALTSEELLISWSPDGSTVAHRVDDGSEIWVQPNVIPMAVDTDGTIYAYSDGIVELDPTDGTSTQVIGSDAIGMTVDATAIQDDQLILTGRSGASGFDPRSGEQLWVIDIPPAVAPLALTSNMIVVAIDSGVAVFAIP